ncbi:hydrolase [Cryptosporidium xiaoi]|uniref:Hydrolase n=1 Tax=Cryptosporidium xiaoi TaxID=659607 RepID=A0AAV9XSP7_9CRYT
MWHNNRLFSGNFALRLSYLILFLFNLTIVAFSGDEAKCAANTRGMCKFADLGLGRTRYSIVSSEGQEDGSFESKNKVKRIVLIHGFMGDLTTFNEWRKILANNGYTVLTYDLLGHGESEWKISGFISVEKLVLQLNQLLDKLGWINNGNKISLLGVSLGGLISVKYAVTYPDDINKLVLMCPAGMMTQEDSPKLYKLSKSYEVKLLSNLHRHQKAFRCGINCLSSMGFYKFAQGISKKERKKEADELHKYISTFIKVGGNNNLFERHLDYYELSKLESKIEILFLWGIEDDVVPFDSSVNYLAKHFNNTRIVVLPFTGHIPQRKMDFPLNISVRFLDEVNVEDIGVLLGIVGDSNYFYDYTVNVIKGFNFTYSGGDAIFKVDDTNYPYGFFDLNLCKCCFLKYNSGDLPD